jgi:hypothetical protein
MCHSAFSSVVFSSFLGLAFLTGAVLPAAAQTTEFVGAWPYGPAGAVALDAGRSLAFFGSGGVVVTVDVTNPTDPALVSDAIQTRGVVADLAFDVATNRLYVAAGEGGLEIWNVQVPGSPQKLGALGLTYFGVDVPSIGVVVSGSFAYVSASFGYLHRIDVADPANPIDVGFYGQGGNPSAGVFLVDGQVYLGGHRLTRFQIQPNGSLVVSGQNPYTSAGTVFASGNHAYGTNNGDVLVFDTIQSTLPVIGSHTFANARDVFVSGSTAYVADATGGIRVLDVKNPANPVEVGADSTLGTVNVLAAGGYLYATGSNRFRVLDISIPTAPTEVGFRETESLAYDADVEGGYAYVADSGAGFYVLDVSNPANPVRVGHADVPGVALDVDLSGSHAYVACQYSGLRVFDIQDPANPTAVGAQATPDYARGVFVHGSIAYVADLTAGLRVIDVSNPAVPAELGAAALPAFSNHVYVQGSFAYVANGSSGLSVVDVSNPAAPVQVNSVSSSNYMVDVFVQGNTAYIADFNGGLRILSLSNPANPVEVGTYAPPGLTAGGVFVSGNFAYVMDAGEDLRVVDVTNPASPVEVAFHDTPGSAFKVFVVGSDLFIADGVAGLQIARFGTTTAAPLPVASRLGTKVLVEHGVARFSLPEAGLSLQVYDVHGRRVFGSRGPEEVRFAPEASGAYFWRVEGSAGLENGKVVLVR